MALQAPIDRLTHRALREAVLDLKERERRRSFPFVLHVGVPGGSVTEVEDRGTFDAGLRADLVLALLQRAARSGRSWVWLTRPGELSIHDGDVGWASAVRWAAAATASPVGLVVVTRRGWFDPESGVRREWQRLRRRTRPAGSASQSQV